MSLAKECRRIFVSGAKCGALAVKGTNYCFFHQAARDFHRENVKRYKSIVVPPIEDRASIHVAIQATIDAIGSNRMDPARARVYLYALQLAMQNIGKDGVPFAAANSVTNPVCADHAEFLAPEEIDCDEIDPDEDHNVEIHNDAQPPSALPVLDVLPGYDGLNDAQPPSVLDTPSILDATDIHNAPPALDAVSGPDLSGSTATFGAPDERTWLVGVKAGLRRWGDFTPTANVALKGHDFSRAINALEMSGALAPEGSSSNIEATEPSAHQNDAQSQSANAVDSSGALASEGDPVRTAPPTASSSPALFASSKKSLQDQEGGSDRGPHGQVLVCGVDSLQVSDSFTKAFGPPSPANSRKPVAAVSSPDDESLNAQSIDISASADGETPSDDDGEPAHSLACYGLVRVWQCEERELTEDELRKHKYVDGLINHTLRALYAAKPFRSQADRRRLREQTRSEFYNEYLVPRPEPRNCTVTTRYCALLLS